jgi:hypothetical protein
MHEFKIIVPESINRRYPGISCAYEARHHGKACTVLKQYADKALIRTEDQSIHEHDTIHTSWLQQKYVESNISV